MRQPRPHSTEDPRDLAEFVLRWHEFRAIAERSLIDIRDDRQKAMVLGWLIRLAECVGPQDLPHQGAGARKSV